MSEPQNNETQRQPPTKDGNAVVPEPPELHKLPAEDTNSRVQDCLMIFQNCCCCFWGFIVKAQT